MLVYYVISMSSVTKVLRFIMEELTNPLWEKEGRSLETLTHLQDDPKTESHKTSLLQSRVSMFS